MNRISAITALIKTSMNEQRLGITQIARRVSEIRAVIQYNAKTSQSFQEEAGALELPSNVITEHIGLTNTEENFSLNTAPQLR